MNSGSAPQQVIGSRGPGGEHARHSDAEKPKLLRRSSGLMQAVRAAMPAGPFLIFLLLFLVVPLGIIVKTAITDDEIVTAMPRTTAAPQSWDGEGLPDGEVYDILAREFREVESASTLRPLGRRLEYELAGGMRAVTRGQAALAAQPDLVEPEAIKAALIKASPAWGQVGIWRTLQRYDGQVSTFFLRWAVGLPVKHNAEGQIVENRGYDFPSIYLRTLVISLTVTVLAVLFGYPVAYAIATSSRRLAAMLLFFVVLPFWTSMLVRSMSWVVVLQSNGVINQFLINTGLVNEPLTLLYTRTVAILAMTQIQLPFAVLPMIGVMRAIPMGQVSAARSLGAPPLMAHVSVFLPQAMPGISAGALVTFVLSLGFYITPALVGGPSDQMVSFFIARFTNEELNWGLASALSVILCCGAGLVALPLAGFIQRHSPKGKKT